MSGVRTAGLMAGCAAALAAASLAGCAQVGEGVRRARSAVVAAPTCQNFTFPLYFQTGSDQLTPDGLKVIDNYAPRVSACPGARVQVTGLADASGSAERNLELSRTRAAVVSQVLAARGFPAPGFEGEGDVGASTRSATEPLRRRAEVSVQFAAATPVR